MLSLLYVALGRMFELLVLLAARASARSLRSSCFAMSSGCWVHDERLDWLLIFSKGSSSERSTPTGTTTTASARTGRLASRRQTRPFS